MQTNSFVQSPSGESVRLAKLAAGIRDAHASSIRSLRMSVDHAITCGRLLLTVKPRGSRDTATGETWLEKNVSFSSRTARQYMQLAQFPAEKRRRVADMGIHGLRDVLAYIAEKSPDDVPTNPYTIRANVTSEVHRITSVCYPQQADPPVVTVKPIYEAQTEEVAAPPGACRKRHS